MATLHALVRRWLPEPVRDALLRGLSLSGLQLARFPGVEMLGAQLRAAVQRYDINCVLDVGGNTGGYGRLLRSIGYRGRIVSFEPVAATFDELQRRTRSDRNWRTVRLALGEKEGTCSINVGHSSVFSSLLAPTDFSTTHFGEASTVTRVEDVPMKRLEDVLPELLKDITEPRLLLKLDTQGYDLQVLAGAGAVLSQVYVLQSELSVQPLYVGAPSYVESLDTLRGLGFELSGVYPLERDQDLGVIEFDCVMVRRRPEATAATPP
jgi:FkbM family methyltransferase